MVWKKHTDTISELGYALNNYNSQEYNNAVVTFPKGTATLTKIVVSTLLNVNVRIPKSDLKAIITHMIQDGLGGRYSDEDTFRIAKYHAVTCDNKQLVFREGLEEDEIYKNKLIEKMCQSQKPKKIINYSFAREDNFVEVTETEGEHVSVQKVCPLKGETNKYMMLDEKGTPDYTFKRGDDFLSDIALAGVDSCWKNGSNGTAIEKIFDTPSVSDYFNLVPIYPEKLKSGPKRNVDGIAPLKKISSRRRAQVAAVANGFGNLGYAVERRQYACFEQTCVKPKKHVSLDDVIDTFQSTGGHIVLKRKEYTVRLEKDHLEFEAEFAKDKGLTGDVIRFLNELPINLSGAKATYYKKEKDSAKKCSAIGCLFAAPFVWCYDKISTAVQSKIDKHRNKINERNAIILATLKEGNAVKSEHKESCILVIDEKCMLDRHERKHTNN